MIRLFVAILVAIFFLGCESKPTRPMLISTNLWIGYSPLYYAQKKGWLRQNNIKLVQTISLGESFKTFKSGAVDMLCGTQYEIRKACKDYEDKGGVIMLDRSNGGDKILSNFSIDELKSKKKIDLYLEVESVNSVLFEYFMQKHALSKKQINFINKTPDISSKLRMKTRPTVIVTYSPYNNDLEEKGYKEIASTKDNDLLVLDAVYVPPKTMKQFPRELDRLNFLIAKSLKDLESNPKEYFNVINSEFNFDNYEEFKIALSSIEWIYDNHSVVINKRAKMSILEVLKLIKPYKVGK